MAGIEYTSLKVDDEDHSGVSTAVLRVAVASDAKPAEVWAADKLACTLSLPIVRLSTASPAAAAAVAQIAVGYGAAMALGASPSALSRLGDESFLITAAPGGSAIVASSAGSARGTINGAFKFMEILGFRFFTANFTERPKERTAWQLPPGFRPITFTPPLKYRDMIASPVTVPYSETDRSPHSLLNFSQALGLNGQQTHGPVAFGNAGWAEWSHQGIPESGRHGAGFVATAYNLLSPDLLNESPECGPHPHNTPCLSVWRANPEWFVCKPLDCPAPCRTPSYPCTVDEVNRTYNSQPCWSNTSLQQYMVSSLLRILRQNPNAKSISVSNMDGPDPPECPVDQPTNREENTTGGANMRAVQAIADKVNQEFPRVKIVALAYNAALEPPIKLKLGPNVIVQLCLGGTVLNQFVPMADPKNAPAVRLVRAWRRVVKALYIWDYDVSFHSNLLPFPNYRTQATHVQELSALGVTGYFGQSWGKDPGVDMIDMKTWVVARTAFDPSLNASELVEEFTDAFYSAEAAVHVRAYMSILEAAFASSNFTLDYTGKPVPNSQHLNFTFGCYSNDTLLAAASALSAAKKAAAPGEIYQLRLSQAMANIQFVILQRWQELREHAAATSVGWPLSATLAAEFERFSAAMTFAFRGSTLAPQFLQKKVVCDLPCFAKQLGLGNVSIEKVNS